MMSQKRWPMLAMICAGVLAFGARACFAAAQIQLQDLIEAEPSSPYAQTFVISPLERHLVQMYVPSLGERAAFGAVDGDFDALRLFHVAFDGTVSPMPIERLSSGRGGFLGTRPMFSPDGKRLSFARPAPNQDGGWVMSILQLETLELVDLPLRVHSYHNGTFATAVWVSKDVLVYVADPESKRGVPYGNSVGVLGRDHAQRRWSAQSGMSQPAVVSYPGQEADRCWHGRMVVYDVNERSHRVVHETEVRGLQALGDGRHAVGLEPCALASKTKPMTVNDAQVKLGLLLLDTTTGTVSRPCGDCNIKWNSLTVAPDGGGMAFYAYDASGIALDARLFEYRVGTRTLRQFDLGGVLPDSLDPRVDFNTPGELVWLGKALAVHGAQRPSGATTDLMPLLLAEKQPRRDWYVLNVDRRPVPLTSKLQEFSDQPLAVDGESLLIQVANEIRRFAAGGSMRTVAVLPAKSGRLKHLPEDMPWAARSPFIRTPLRAQMVLAASETDGSALYWWDGKLVRLGSIDGDVRAASRFGTMFISRHESQGAVRIRLHRRARGADDFATHDLLAVNQSLREYWPQSREAPFTGPDGVQYSACLYLPQGHATAGALPLIVDAYPAISATRRDCANHFAHGQTSVFAMRGYAVLAMYMPVGVRNASDGSFNDISQWMDSAIHGAAQLANIDLERIGLRGESQGGFVVAELLTRTDRFKAAVAGISDVDYFSLAFGQHQRNLIADNPSSGGGAVTRFVAPEQFIWMGKMPWEDPDAYTRLLPIFRADRIKTPLYLWTTEFDGFSSNSFFQLYNVLKMLGREVELDYYFNEGHGLNRPANEIHQYQRLFDWYDARLR